MESIVKLMQQRSDLISKARNLITRAEGEDRNLSAEENVEYGKWFAESNELKQRIDRLENLSVLTAELDAPQTRITSSTVNQPITANAGLDSQKPFTMNLHGQPITFEAGSEEWRRNQPDARAGFRSYLLGGPPTQFMANISRTNDVAGGYLTAPEQFVGEVIKDIENVFIIRNYARKFSTFAKSLGAPRRTRRLDAFKWGTEYSTPTKDGNTAGTGIAYGKRSFTPHDMTGEVDVSNEFMRSALIDPESMVREEIAYGAGELEEQAFMTGNGVGQPMGLFTASANGISTNQDVQTGSATAFTADGLRQCKYKLKEFYRNHPSTRWIFNRTCISLISQLKASGTGQYLWKEGISEGEPDRLLGIPLAETEYAPNTMTTGLYVGGLFCLYFYWIIDGLDFGIQRLVELEARANQTVYLIRRKIDANVSKEEAFARLITN